MKPASEEADIARPTGSEGWLTSGRFAAILAGLLFLGFPEVVLGLKTFFHHDFAIFGYSLAHYHRESFWRGEIPLWNPLSNCGLPFLAQWNTMVLYPGSLFYLLFPLSWSLGVFCLAHQFLGGLGMYFLARRWTGDGLAAAVAGVAFAFNGLMLNCLMWPNNITALGWMPWVCLAVERGVEGGGRRLILAALVGAMQMLSGAPEVILFTWVVLAVLLFVRILQGGPARWIQSGRFVVIVVLVSALAAAQLLPFFELFRHCQRDTAYGDYGSAMPGTGWANFLIPMYRCFESRYSVYFQPYQIWTTSYYCGVAILALALAGAFLVRQGRVWALAALSCLGLVLALGKDGFLYSPLRAAFPVLGFVNFPVKFVVLPVFCAPLLAALAVCECHKAPAGGGSRPWRVLWLLAGGLLVLMAGLLYVENIHPAIRANWGVTWHNALSRAFFLWAIPGSLYLLKRIHTARSQWLLQSGLLLMLALDFLTHVPWQNPTITRSIYEPGMAHPDLVPAPKHGESRVALDAVTYDWVMYARIRDPVAHYIGLRLVLYENLNLLDDIPRVDGFYSLYLRAAEPFSRFISSSTNMAAPLYDFLAVSHMTKPGRLEWQKRPGTMRMVTAGQRPLFTDSRATLRAMLSPAFEPRLEVYLPLEAKSLVAVTDPTEAKVVSSRFAAHRNEIEVTSAQPSLVVVSQSFYPCWHAYVDGKTTPLWRANYAFQAVAVPAGRHRVELVYQDDRFLCGAWISGLTLAACLGVWMGTARRERRDRSSTRPPGQSAGVFRASRV